MQTECHSNNIVGVEMENIEITIAHFVKYRKRTRRAHRTIPVKHFAPSIQSQVKKCRKKPPNFCVDIKINEICINLCAFLNVYIVFVWRLVSLSRLINIKLLFRLRFFYGVNGGWKQEDGNTMRRNEAHKNLGKFI